MPDAHDRALPADVALTSTTVDASGRSARALDESRLRNYQGVKVFSRPLSRRLWQLFGSATRCGPLDGACVAYARALAGAYSGCVWVLRWPSRPHEPVQAQHALTRIGADCWIDAYGVATSARSAQRRFMRRESIRSPVHARARPIRPKDLTDSPRLPRLERRLARLVRQASANARSLPPFIK